MPDTHCQWPSSSRPRTKGREARIDDLGEIMGITHFCGLGTSPGAVTAGLSYLKHERMDSPEYGKIVERVVIFTSAEIVNGNVKANPNIIYNDYMKEQATTKKRTSCKENSLDIVAEYLYKEIGDGEYFVCDLDVNNLAECFETVSKALLRFHRPGDVGKHIWANITGGSNVLNAAIMQTAYLSGLIPYLYYTFVANRADNKYLQPFSHDRSRFDFRDLYVFKTTLDERYQAVLHELKEFSSSNPGEWISSKTLLSRLKGKGDSRFIGLKPDAFVRDYLNIMLGIERKGSRAEGQKDANRLNNEGYRILSMLESPLFEVLTRQKDITHEKNEKLIADLKISELDRRIS